MWRLIWILLLVEVLEFTWEHWDNFSLLDSYHGILTEFFFLKLTFFMPQGARSKTRKPRKSRKFFPEIFESEFSILAVEQNRKLGNKKTWNNFSKISEIFDFSEFSICHFFIFQSTETAVRRCSWKYVFLKILEYSWEGTCVGVSFLKDCRTGAFLRVLRNF